MTVEQLQEFVSTARWFGGKGRDFHLSGVRRLGVLDPSGVDCAEGEDEVRVTIELATVEYADGSSEQYQIPLSYYSAPQERLARVLVGQWKDDDLGDVFAYDALHDRFATPAWLSGFASSTATDTLVFRRLEGHDLEVDCRSTVFTGEQSNSSVAFGEDSLMKVFRKVTPGSNPDIEIHAALTAAESTHIAALYGWLETVPADGEEPLQLGMLQQFLRTASDGWELALASVRDLFAEGDLHADEVGGDFAAESHRLGVATAEVHNVLADSFPTKRSGLEELRELSLAMTRRLEAAVEVVPDLAPHADALQATFERVSEVAEPIVVQRVHGDLHLGQTLRTSRGWKIVDFEGEPAKPLSERVRPDSAWRDVAGMLRSFDYAAHSVEVDLEEGAQIAYRAREWVERNQQAFLEGYVEATGRTAGVGLSGDQQVLLDAYEADKAVYETVYEARNRPDWVGIPLAAILRLTKHQDRQLDRAPQPDAQEAHP
jgi:maltokinase